MILSELVQDNKQLETIKFNGNYTTLINISCKKETKKVYEFILITM